MKRAVLFLALLSFTPLPAQDFALEQVEGLFPSAGFEGDIEFWRQMFTRYGEKQVVFHDRRDLRLIYQVVHFDQGIAFDPEEAERQSDILKDHKKRLEMHLDGLAQGLAEDQYTEEQAGIVRRLHKLGYQPDAGVYRSLIDQIRYQRGIKEEFRAGLVRSGRYRDRIGEIFARHGLPPELAVLPHIESSFRHEVRSKAGAVGLWQFVSGTGRLFMTVNRSIDQRYDPLESTEAAAQLLKSNYDALGSWPLAITAYNHGTNGMKRARRQFGTNFLRIAREYQSRSFGFASRNFYPEFLAALEVVRNQERYFGPVQVEPPARFETFQLPRSYAVRHVTEVEGIELDALRELNPALRSRVWRSGTVPAGFTLRVPEGTSEALAAALESVEPRGAAPTQVAADGSRLYRVQPGESLGTIATRFGVSTGQLARANSISNPNRIHPGQVLSIPAGVNVAAEPIRYRVRRGDNLATIGARFGVTPGQLARVNSLSNRNLIHAGQVLTIPAGGTLRSQPTRYRVRRGDTLIEIAQRFGTSLRALIEANNLRNANRIVLGQVLLIP